ncbi:MAG: copper chaperone PCu(A)C [Solirubrobacterales bacterium]
MAAGNARPIAALAAIGAASALLAACGGGGSDTGSSGGGLSVNGVWTRATAPSQTTGAVYMTIESDQSDALVDASVPKDVAGRAELHETTGSGGGSMRGEDSSSGDASMSGGESGAMLGMKPVSKIPIAAGEPTVLEPGGYHVMLFDLKGPVEAGESIPVALRFEKAGGVKVTAMARGG